MTVESLAMIGERGARVQHLIPNDLTWSSYFTLVEVIENSNTVIVKTPLACPQPISNLELQSVVQLILGKAVTVGAQAVDTRDHLEQMVCPRRWQTFEYAPT